MTLGGLALAIGILVDDSTVTIENTHRLLTEERMPLPSATLHGAAGIAVPTLVSTLAISCVFVSVVFLHGPAKYLFTPLGFAVVFAMLASYGFSRTLTPITIGLLLKGERRDEAASRGWFARQFAKFERGFETMRNGYTEILHTLLTRRTIVPVGAVVVLGLGVTLFMFVGRDFFPIIEQRVTTYGQYALSSSVNGIRDIEAQTISGVLSPVYCQMIVTTGMLISGKISVGIDSTAVPPRNNTKAAST